MQQAEVNNVKNQRHGQRQHRREAEVHAFPRLEMSLGKAVTFPRVMLAVAFATAGATLAWLIVSRRRVRAETTHTTRPYRAGRLDQIEPMRGLSPGDIDVAPAP
jgi:hypothetical protein